ncbi:hypothetical protein DPMN_139268 [Dreissena polymorpha]|uniref:Uncharacterized protein n=1 Tax=Dreissena polymorpha TaxID=45954 RepID=A0A9D4G972_DREPO|nr:hypothetical protein DPMN_139268 [Dreissena polymorpha]
MISGLTVVAFNISVTNDASTYSNEVTYVRTDGRCAKCVKTGESCSVKVTPHPLKCTSIVV